ncbi:MAG TPA: hypothetical protein VME20_01500 [Acidimicrobiales bacterium]|nr:hypothetical protein [Acidimicrobiales bacterium]
MARTIDLFIDSDQELPELAARLSELLRSPLSPSPDGARYSLHEAGVTAYLARHDFVDDDDLPLNEFRYVLSAVVQGEGRLEESPPATYLRRANRLLRESSGLASLLVLDLEQPDSAPN